MTKLKHDIIVIDHKYHTLYLITFKPQCYTYKIAQILTDTMALLLVLPMKGWRNSNEVQSHFWCSVRPVRLAVPAPDFCCFFSFTNRVRSDLYHVCRSSTVRPIFWACWAHTPAFLAVSL